MEYLYVIKQIEILNSKKIRTGYGELARGYGRKKFLRSCKRNGREMNRIAMLMLHLLCGIIKFTALTTIVV